MLKFRQILINLRASFWCVPTLIVLVSIILAIALIEADTAVSDRWLPQWPRLFGAGAEGSRQQMQWIAELAERTIESPHDRAHIKMRLTPLRETLEVDPALGALEVICDKGHS